MFATCLFCHGPLGTNESVESFPVGRRLAFDAARGRLWVVCRRCERWNLSPLEERWEAIESAERLFRGTRLRVSTGEIGLARVAEGLELVRVGQPMRPEFAAWRYGDQFGRRRRKALIAASSAAVGSAVAYVVGGIGVAALTGGVGGSLWVGQLVGGVFAGVQSGRRRRQLDPPKPGDALGLELYAVERARLVPDPHAEGGWALRHPRCVEEPTMHGLLRRRRMRVDWERLTGNAALRASGTLLARANRATGARRTVERAVRRLEEAGSAHAVFQRAARLSESEWYALACLPGDIRLALEMAAHEDVERRALDGELAELERAWREAEEIASIADSLTEPSWLSSKLAALRHRDPGHQPGAS